MLAWPRMAMMPPPGRPMLPSADSSSILCKLLLSFTVIVFMDPLFDFCGTQLPIRLDDRSLAVQPFWLDRIQPRCLDRQVADPYLAASLPLHPTIVRPDPATHPLTDVPGSIVPNQHENLFALRSEALAQPTQKIFRHLADRTPLDET